MKKYLHTYIIFSLLLSFSSFAQFDGIPTGSGYYINKLIPSPSGQKGSRSASPTPRWNTRMSLPRLGSAPCASRCAPWTRTFTRSGRSDTRWPLATCRRSRSARRRWTISSVQVDGAPSDVGLSSKKEATIPA